MNAGTEISAVGQKNLKPPQLRAKRARKQRWFRILTLTLVVGFFLLPLVSMFIFSVRYPLTGQWSLAAWRNLFGMPAEGEASTDLALLWEGAGASLALAVATVALMLLLLLPLMLYMQLRPSKMNSIVEFICLLPLTIPAIVLVVGLGPIYRFLAIYVLNTDTIWLAFAYTILVLPFAFRALDAGFKAINVKTLVEAARSLGCTWTQVMFKVVAPNLRQAILSACFISVAVVLGEYTVAMLLGRVNLQVGLFLVSQNDPMVSTAMSLLTLLAGMAILLAIGLIGQGKKGSKTAKTLVKKVAG